MLFLVLMKRTKLHIYIKKLIIIFIVLCGLISVVYPLKINYSAK